MPPIIIACPQCSMQLRVPATITPGTKVKCPKCAVTFETPAADAAPPLPFQDAAPYSVAPLPPTPAVGGQPTQDYEPAGGPHYQRPGWEQNDFANLDEAPGDYQRRQGIGDLSNEYAIDLGQLFTQAQNHWGEVLGPMIGYIILAGLLELFASLILGLIPIVGPLINGLMIVPQLEAGVVAVALAQLKGRRWSFGDFWSGFNWFLPLMLLRLSVIACFFGCLFPGGIMLIAVSNSKNPVLVAMGVALLIIGVLVLIYLSVRAFTFAVPLIVERNCGAGEAMQGSWVLTEGHFWGWLGIGLLQVLIGLVGYLMCFVGVLFTAPFAVLLAAAGYLQATRFRCREEPGPL